MTSYRHFYRVDKDQYMKTYPYEELKVTVKDGIIAKLDWVAPMEQVRVENENVPVLSLEEIMDTFKKQMQLEYTIGKLSCYAPENSDYDEHISGIEWEKVNITDKDSLGELPLTTCELSLDKDDAKCGLLTIDGKVAAMLNYPKMLNKKK
jgi:hypothetical protein